MSKAFEISEITSVPVNPDNMVGCPYDKTHRVLVGRLPTHLNKCARNYPNIKLLRCPFNLTHAVKSEDMQTHLKECDSVSPVFTMSDGKKILEPQQPLVELADSTECWDDEPPVASYDPQVTCENNAVIRQPQGLTKSQRVAFRQRERQRHRDLQNKK